MSSVCAILNLYKRKDNFEKQVKSLLDQTYHIDEYIIRVNRDESQWTLENIDTFLKWVLTKYDIQEKTKVLYSDKNLWVRSRFFAGYNADSKFLYVLDDDVIPWKYWIEKCMIEFDETPWIYWSRGSLFKSKTDRFKRDVICETNNRPATTIQVDISWHSWFFAKDMLGYMFDKLPAVACPRAWEELWISYRAIKYGINTYIPCMTEDQETRWNKEPRLWIDKVANYNTEKDTYQKFYQETVNHWFTPLHFI